MGYVESFLKVPILATLRYVKPTIKERNQFEQLFQHIVKKTDIHPIHNIFKIIFNVLYYDAHLSHFSSIRNNYDACTLIFTPIPTDTVLRIEHIIRTRSYKH